MFVSTARDFIEKSIETDRDFRAQLRSRDATLPPSRPAGRSAPPARAREVDAFEPNYRGSPIVFGAPGAAQRHRAHTFKAQPAITSRRKLSSGRNVFEELGDGFTLLDFGAPEAVTASIRRAAETSGVPLKLVRDDNAEAREFYEAALVLVRPDQFVAWDRTAM